MTPKPRGTMLLALGSSRVMRPSWCLMVPVPNFEDLLQDLGATPDEEIRGTEALRATLLLFKDDSQEVTILISAKGEQRGEKQSFYSVVG